MTARDEPLAGATPVPRASLGRERRRRSRADRDSLALVIDLIRRGQAETRQEIETLSGLGRAAVAERLSVLSRLRLIEEGDLAASTGGRAPRQIRFRAAAGHLLVAVVGTTTLGVGLTDLSGQLLVEHHEPVDEAADAERILDRVAALFDWMIEENARNRDIWGIGVALPGPVEHAGGRLAAPAVPRLPGWDEVQMVDRLQERFGVPVWIDSEVHATALGELRAGRGAGRSDLLFLEIGNRISVGLCFDKRLHRGAQGYAGDIGHVAVSDDARAICSCGNTGCLEAVAGSQAIARQAIERVGHGESPMLAEILATGRQVTSADVGMAARKGDPLSIELLSRSGRLVGATLATLVNAYNPSLVVVGGGVAQAGEIVLAAIRESVYRHSRSLATRDLQIVRSEMGKTAGLVGIALAVADELFVPSSFAAWMDRGTPIQRAIPRQSGVRHYVGATAAAAPAAAPAPGTRGMIHDETLEVVQERR